MRGRARVREHRLRARSCRAAAWTRLWVRRVIFALSEMELILAETPVLCVFGLGKLGFRRLSALCIMVSVYGRNPIQKARVSRHGVERTRQVPARVAVLQRGWSRVTSNPFTCAETDTRARARGRANFVSNGVKSTMRLITHLHKTRGGRSDQGIIVHGIVLMFQHIPRNRWSAPGWVIDII